jgi:hypothetical protein
MSVEHGCRRLDGRMERFKSASVIPTVRLMAQWKTSIAREPSKTKAELRQEAVRNTQPMGALNRQRR